MIDFHSKPLFIFEMANNHMGDVEHGIKIIREIKKACDGFNFRFAFKLQYRQLDTFIHSDYKDRKDIKYVKRFMETRLLEEDFLALLSEIKKVGFIAICTPFDEVSVDLIEKHNYDALKIGSCSFTDWPLLERIVKTDKPVIASTAGISLEDIDKVVAFFEHRFKPFALMHCVGEYPTPAGNLELNQIDLFRQRYPSLSIGYSTHEDPANFEAIKSVVAKGALLFERHVGVQTEKYALNAYSSSPSQIRSWLEEAARAFEMCGVINERRKITTKEKEDLRGLQRGVFASRQIKAGEKISGASVFFAIPNVHGQVVANDLSKYTEYVVKKDIQPNQPVMFSEVEIKNLRERLLAIMRKIRPILLNSKVALPNKMDLELSHHYGIERFEEYGAVIINCINREYCKKLIILLPGQKHPIHYHVKKEETFHVLYGDLAVSMGGEEREYHAGDMVVVERNAKHGFSSKHGAIFEEISTTHYKEDSFYAEEAIMKNPHRKTEMTFWSDWLSKEIV